jgi:hypothetical protein
MDTPIDATIVTPIESYAYKYYKKNQEKMNTNRMMHYYRKELGKDYVDQFVKSAGKEEALKTFKVINKLRRKINASQSELDEMERLRQTLEAPITQIVKSDV